MKLHTFIRGFALLGVAQAALGAGEGLTEIREKGRCAMRGQCGKQSLFGGELPCADNGLAKDPEDGLRESLVNLCGAKWSEGPICCEADQVKVLSTNLKTAEGILSSCPACKQNFFNLFCTFTCSPDQSLFINITETATKNGKVLVTGLDNLWSPAYGTGFYDSCKDVKLGATGSPAMTFFGNPKNYTQFLSFLGNKRLIGGSPFQINFPVPAEGKFEGMEPADDTVISCNTTDPNYRCNCVDCGSSCPTLPEVQSSEGCHVGNLPCLTFAVILTYGIGMLLLITALIGHVWYIKHKQNKDDRLRLLQDAAPSDDEDEADDDEWAYRAQSTYKPALKPYALNVWLDGFFSRLGRTAAKYPAIVITSSALVAGLFSLGWTAFSVEQDPVRLWVSPDAPAAQEKAFFDSNFGPFFRAEQAFVTNSTHPAGQVLSYETLHWWLDVENRVKKLRSDDLQVSFQDVCYKPTGSACVVQSVSGYFQDYDLGRTDWQDRILDCTEQPANCIPDFGLPLDKNLVLGGNITDPLQSQAIVTSWVVTNAAEDSEQVAKASDFEAKLRDLFLDLRTEAKDRGLRLSFNTEISLEEELNKSTNTDAGIVVVSYIIMFIYASLALGSTTISARMLFKSPSAVLVQSKFSLGIMGILIVLLSVSAAVGLFSAFGIKVTLIIAEVIPFLVLAVGVDNIFLIVHEFERVNASYRHLPIEDRVGRTLGRMGPSILLSATMETVAFALGAIVAMPAVRNFAIYAAGAVVINALLQVTMFVSALALNQRRVEDGRADCIPCVRVKQPISLGDNPTQESGHEEDGLQRFIRKVYAPALLGKKTKAVVLTVFVGLFAAGLALLPTIELGLEQRIAIPTGSYLIDYFDDLADFFNAGPPVYFVTKNINGTSRDFQKQLCGTFPSCNELSLAGILEGERRRPEVSYISSATASWIDDFFHWLDPSLEQCCVEGRQTCFANREPAWNRTLSGMPEGGEFVHYLEKWLEAPSNQECALGGKAPYSNALVYDDKTLTTPATHFRTAHTALRDQRDFIQSYQSARRIANEIQENNPGLEVFPYSKHYIFFDQYGTIVQLTVGLLAAAIAACFVISSVLLGSVRTGLVVSITVAMTIVDIGGALAVAGVSLNAVTLVNLVICVGIAVEFCAHIARAFQFPSMRFLDRNGAVSSSHFALHSHRLNGFAAVPKVLEGRDARAWAAMSQVGGSVFSGITITKLLGVCVLAFTRSKIFEVYYFRVWLALVILAAIHALVLLPVLLSLFGGPKGYLDTFADAGLEDDLIQRRRYLDEEDDDGDDY